MNKVQVHKSVNGWKCSKGETIIYASEAENYAVVLGALGFYVVCTVPNDTYVSDWLYSRLYAIKLADRMEAR